LTALAAPPARVVLLSRFAVAVTAMLFGLTYSLTAPLIAFRLADHGLDETWIGVNAAMHAVGTLLTAPLLPFLAASLGVRRLVVGALALSVLTLLAFAAGPPVWAWFPLRVLLGVASEVLFVLSESWFSHLSTEATRARSMAIFMVSMSAGFAAGPALLSAVGVTGGLPFLAGALPPALAMLLIGLPTLDVPSMHETGGRNPLAALRLAPVAMAATALNAVIETAGLSFLALYAARLGWSATSAAGLVSVMMVGAIALQLPIGWLGDRMDRMRLVALLAAVAVAAPVLWPFVLAQAWLTYAVLFVWGGAFVGIYTMMMTVVGSRFQGTALIGIYAVMGIMWGLGALLGPPLAGLAMDASTHGLPAFAAAVCALFLGLVIARRCRGA
jgi:MFS family permease